MERMQVIMERMQAAAFQEKVDSEVTLASLVRAVEELRQHSRERDAYLQQSHEALGTLAKHLEELAGRTTREATSSTAALEAVESGAQARDAQLRGEVTQELEQQRAHFKRDLEDVGRQLAERTLELQQLVEQHQGNFATTEGAFNTTEKSIYATASSLQKLEAELRQTQDELGHFRAGAAASVAPPPGLPFEHLQTALDTLRAEYSFEFQRLRNETGASLAASAAAHAQLTQELYAQVQSAACR